MVPNADISPGLNALAQGLQQYRGNQRRNALELAVPQAMAGDQAAQNRLLALDPNLGMQVQNNRAQQAEGRRTLIKDTLTQDALAMAHMTDEQLAQAFPQRAQRWLEQFPELQGKITPDFDQTVRPTIMGLAGIKPEQVKPQGMMNISPGGAVFDPETGRAVYQAPYKPDEGQKPPAGYRWANGGLTFIPGGPADPAVRAQNSGGLSIDPETGALTVGSGFKTKPIPAELAARIALGESYAKQVPDILASIAEQTTTDTSGRLSVATGFGKGAAVARRQASGVDALIRNLTGAGMTMTEAESYAKRYQIQSTDSAETQRNKVLQLTSELSNTDRTIRTQYGQQPSAAYSGIPIPPNLSDELGQQTVQPGGIKFLGFE